MLECRLTPAGQLTLSPSVLPADTINVPYNQAFAASGAENTFYANQVVSYVPGTIPDASYNNPSAALGGLNPVTGTFDGTSYYLTPFNPAFSASDLVEVGAGGSLVLKLAQTASTNGYTIGVHTGFGLVDAAYPNGTNTDPATYVDSWLRQANVQVSADGVNWGNLGTITFSNPSNINTGAATDPEGGSPGVGPAANPGKPFLGSLSSFNGQNWQGTLAELNGSAGGAWLNLNGVTDENGNPISGVNYIQFTVPGAPPLDPGTGNPEIMTVDAVVGTNSNASISANGGTGAVALTVSNVQHPIAGLVVPASGTNGLNISGTPTASGTETFTVSALDSAGNTVAANYSVTVNPAVTFSTPTLTAGTLNVPYNQTISASHGTGAITYTVSDIQNPIAGLNVPAKGPSASSPSAGAPTTAGTETFMVAATDSLGIVTAQPYTVTIDPTLTINPVSLPVATVGDRFTAQLTASGGSGAGYAFKAIAGPAWLKVTSTGLVYGTPTAGSASTVRFSVFARDSQGRAASHIYTLTVDRALVLRPTALPAATMGDAYRVQLSATGGPARAMSSPPPGCPPG